MSSVGTDFLNMLKHYNHYVKIIYFDKVTPEIFIWFLQLFK